MKHIFQFGETVDGFLIPVLNEREARAGAGILFILAITSFFNAFLLRDFSLIKVFIVVFFVDFFIRVLINPRFAPSLILGRIMVGNQKPEYVGAPQKRFAWAIGLILSIAMFFVVVLGNTTGIIPLSVCAFCLTLLFLETSFGICVGCKLYALILRKPPQLCPGSVCEIDFKEDIQKVSTAQIAVLATSLIVLGYVLLH